MLTHKKTVSYLSHSAKRFIILQPIRWPPIVLQRLEKCAESTMLHGCFVIYSIALHRLLTVSDEVTGRNVYAQKCTSDNADVPYIISNLHMKSF